MLTEYKEVRPQKFVNKPLSNVFMSGAYSEKSCRMDFLSVYRPLASSVKKF